MPWIKRIVYEPAKSVTTYTFVFDPGPGRGEFEHLEEKGPFAVTGPDGETESFGDKPPRYLAVASDPEIGRFVPMASRRMPVFLGPFRESSCLVGPVK